MSVAVASTQSVPAKKSAARKAAPAKPSTPRRSHSQFLGVHDAMLAANLRPVKVASLGKAGYGIVDKATDKRVPGTKAVASKSAARRMLYKYEQANGLVVSARALKTLRDRDAKSRIAPAKKGAAQTA